MNQDNRRVPSKREAEGVVSFKSSAVRAIQQRWKDETNFTARDKSTSSTSIATAFGTSPTSRRRTLVDNRLFISSSWGTNETGARIDGLTNQRNTVMKNIYSQQPFSVIRAKGYNNRIQRLMPYNTSTLLKSLLSVRLPRHLFMEQHTQTDLPVYYSLARKQSIMKCSTFSPREEKG